MRSQHRAAHQRHADSHLGLRSSPRPGSESQYVTLLDDLDPASDFVASQRLHQLGMIAADVILDPVDDLIVGLASCDVAALAFDLPGHLISSAGDCRTLPFLVS